MVGLKYNSDLPADKMKKKIPISIKFVAVFHVNMLQQLHLQVN